MHLATVPKNFGFKFLKLHTLHFSCKYDHSAILLCFLHS